MKRQNKVAPALAVNTFHKNMSFHVSMRNILLEAQISGFMPVIGICQPQVSCLKFSRMSWRMLYCLLTLFGAIFLSTIQLKKLLSIEIKMRDIHKLCLYITAVCSSILFLILAKKWPRFVKTWNRVDMAMYQYGWPVKVNRRINCITVIFIVLVCFEYNLLQILEYVHANSCKDQLKDVDVMKIYLKNKFNRLYLPDNNVFFAPLLMYTDFQAFFSCTFIDIFIMVLSTSLAARLKQIRKRIKASVVHQCADENTWKDIREDYDKLENLCKMVNSEFSWFIILSFAGNLCLILIQLYNSFQIVTKMGRIYLYYSFGFLIMRTSCVCIYGAAVNDESRKSLIHLYNLSDSAYNKEVERLVHQISTSNMALSGLNFFLIKRNLILKIAGALVTYELIIIQVFDQILKSSEGSSGWSCTT